VTCSRVTKGKRKHRQTVQKCATKLSRSPVPTPGRFVAAVLSPGNIVCATGSAIQAGRKTELVLTALHAK
jgi:hypothetical protein